MSLGAKVAGRDAGRGGDQPIQKWLCNGGQATLRKVACIAAESRWKKPQTCYLCSSEKLKFHPIRLLCNFYMSRRAEARGVLAYMSERGGVEEGLMHPSDASIHKVRLHQGATYALGGLALTQHISDHSCAAGHGGVGWDDGSPRTSPPSLQRISEQLKRLKTSLSCLISCTHLFLINCPNNYTNELMCQFAVTHEVPPPGELAKMHKKISGGGGGGSMYFHRRSQVYYFYYPTVQPRYDSSDLLIILLLWNTADANWRFLRWLLARGSDFFAHLLFVIMRSCSADVLWLRKISPAVSFSFFCLLSLISHGAISNRGRLAFLAPFFSSRCRRRQRANNAERRDNNTFGSKWRSWLR